MSDLSRDTRDVVEAGARALGPSAEARARIRAAVGARVSGSPGDANGDPGGQVPAAATAKAGGALLRHWVSLAAITAVLGGGAIAWYAARAAGADQVASPPTPRTAAAVAAGTPAAQRPDFPAVAAVAGEAVPLAADATHPAPLRSPAARRRPPRTSERPASELELEVQLLSSARRALAGGDPTLALGALERHRRELRAPQMRREAALLRAEALCGAGRTEAGRAELAEIRAAWPGSSGIEAVRAACGD